MKYYLVLCYADRLQQAPAKKMVVDEKAFHCLATLFSEYACIVVEPLEFIVE